MATVLGMSDRVIEVNALSVRHALARAFVGGEPDDHAWRGRVAGGPEITVDVRPRDDGLPYVHAGAEVLEVGPLDARVARTLLIENGELVLGRFAHDGSKVCVEHAILAGSTMAAVEVKASVWSVGWAAGAFAPRLRALLADATPPPAPVLPAALRRDAADHVTITEKRVGKFLEQRFGGFQQHPDWGFHGPFGSARVFVDVLPVLDDSTAVRASSPVVSNVDLVDELALELLERSSREPFGTFLYASGRREVWFQHAVLGDDLDMVEFEAAIEVVATTADGSDDALVERFGGLRYADLG
jgi:hypothetical protein